MNSLKIMKVAVRSSGKLDNQAAVNLNKIFVVKKLFNSKNTFT